MCIDNFLSTVGDPKFNLDQTIFESRIVKVIADRLVCVGPRPRGVRKIEFDVVFCVIWAAVPSWCDN